MIVPQFWAESRLQHREKGRQVTLRRFGWSDTSAADAQANADLRVREALDRVLAGERLPSKDPKIPYNGAAGVPIREEVVSRHGETVITRNSYGARCLNTPNVLFADVDFAEGPSLWFSFAVSVVLVLCAVAVAWAADSRVAGIAAFLIALLLTSTISSVTHRAIQGLSGGAEHAARTRTARFLRSHPEWNVRLYRTPKGLRVAATHQTYLPSDPAVAECFRALRADPLYAAMCLNQQCFRARVSAKPWRIGIAAHLKPRPGVWPVAAERLPQRDAWIAGYEGAARSYAACAYVESLGSGTVHPAIKPVLDLHDELCAVHRRLPIA